MCRSYFGNSLLIWLLILHANCCGITIASWNTLNGPPNRQDVYFERVIEEFQRIPVDLLVLIETDRRSSRDVLSMLNGRDQGFALITSLADRGGDRTAFVYDQQALRLTDVRELTGLTHSILVGGFEPIVDGYADAFTVYALQLKSGDKRLPVVTRGLEAEVIRQDIVTSGRKNVIVTGDFNLLCKDEPAWGVLTAVGAGQLLDLVDTPSQWRGNPEISSFHTQDPREKLDDRFDLHLATPSFFDGDGPEYVRGSFRVLGNNGTHTLGQSILTGNADRTLLESLVSASDHLPVISEWAVNPFPPGDSNRDHVFDQRDLIMVLSAGKYLTLAAASWGDGDWNRDGAFDSLDLVMAVSKNTYLARAYDIDAVPEPSGALLCAVALVIFFCAGVAART